MSNTKLEEGKYIKFVKFADTGKTEKYYVTSKEEIFNLGEIKWFSRWRCYAFFPNENTVYEKKCMIDIAEFLIHLMEKRKNGETK